MTMNELMERILEILPEAVFDEDIETGEIVVATGLTNETDGELKPVTGSNF
jgi:hypothetical protein